MNKALLETAKEALRRTDKSRMSNKVVLTNLS